MAVDQNSDKNRGQEDDPFENVKYPAEFAVAGWRVQWAEDTGKQCVRFIGPSGSMWQISPDGTIAHYSVGEEKKYCKSGFTLSIDENGDVVVMGHSKVQVGAGAHIEVRGDAGIFVGGDVALAATGNMGIQASGNMYLGARGNLNVNVEGDMTLSAQGNSVVETGGTMKIGSGSGTTVQGTTVALNPAGGSSGFTGGSSDVA